MVLLTGCASPNRATPPARGAAPTPAAEEVRSALLEHRPAAAREALATALRNQPQDGYLHLLNGLSYQLEGRSVQSLELAKVGYDAAVKFAPGHYWSHYFAGAAALEIKEYVEAAEQFSKAILADPQRPQAFLGLAIAAYYAGDLVVARVAVDRALWLAPAEPLALRTVAFAIAAEGDESGLQRLLASNPNGTREKPDLGIDRSRLTRVLRAAGLELAQNATGVQGQTNPPAPPQPPKEAEATNQVMVEVTLILKQDSITHNAGINLLDNLTATFELSSTSSKSFPGPPASRLLTTAITIPRVTYSLNLFNHKHDFYRVVARPSLVAYLGQPSEFFIGRTVNAAVSGINLGSIQPIDIGTSVKVTPTEITTNHTKVRVEIGRSFGTDSLGNFPVSLTTFKQRVDATAELAFGKTLILSGLYEGVDTHSYSKTPILGDIPGVNTLFFARTATERRDVALVLLTPTMPGSLQTDTRKFRGETLTWLLGLWSHIDPMSNLDAIRERIEHHHNHTPYYTPAYNPKPGDLWLPTVEDPRTLRTAVEETVAQLH